MNRVEPSAFASLQHKTDKIRNICILAHIDHGKTTLSDSLVCSNGIISAKLSGKIDMLKAIYSIEPIIYLKGKLRFLDSTEDEQKRGITMHSSAISLLYRMNDKKASKEGITSTGSSEAEEYLINLVDSPGHIDFSCDVSTATRLCDGALIVVDVLEGLCTQTHAVLYKALKERMRPCLILNKIDRLALELQLSPIEAFHHLRRVLENVNALASTLLNSELIRMREDALHLTQRVGEYEQSMGDKYSNDEELKLSASWTFAPERGNVIFAAALDSWGFGTGRFATTFAQQLGLNRAVLLKYLFESYAYNPTTKKLYRCDLDAGDVPMFATMVLEPIWCLYHTCVSQQNVAQAAAIAKETMNIDLPPREVNVRDPRGTLQSIMRRWLPLPDAILRMVVRCMPSPRTAQSERIDTLFLPLGTNPLSSSRNSAPVEERTDAVYMRVLSLREGVKACDTGTSPHVVAYVAKMTEIRTADLSPRDLLMLTQRRVAVEVAAEDNRGDASTGLGDVVFMALARVYSGVLRRDSRIFVLGHRHDPLSYGVNDDAEPDGAVPVNLNTATEIPPNSFGLYLCFGPSVYPVEEASAGNIVGIVGLQEWVLKTGTLSSSWAASPMAAMTFQAKPLVRVAVEPLSHRDLPRVEAGLQSLFQYDPVVEVGVDDVGQHTMTCLGELHLEQCLKVLTERFAKCEVRVSAPLVPFRETVLVTNAVPTPSIRPALPPPWKDTPGLEASVGGRVRLLSSNQSVAMTLRCCSLPLEAVGLLDEGLVGPTNALASAIGSNLSEGSVSEGARSLWQRFVASLQAAVVEGRHDSAWAPLSQDESSLAHSDLFSRIVAMGPKGCGPNVLILTRDVNIDVWLNLVPGSKEAALAGAEVSHELVGSSRKGTLLCSLSRRKKVQVSDSTELSFDAVWARIQSAVQAGFQAVAAAGPLMQEPLHGVCFVIESIAVTSSVACLSPADLKVFLALVDPDVDPTTAVDEATALSTAGKGHLSGQLLSEVRDALRLSMLSCPLRVVEPIYACSLQCDQSQLGSLYAVLSKRRGEVTKEDIIEGTSLFVLSATLPVSESFGFAQELLKKTSGSGTAPQLVFSHWVLHSDDPFWKPSTSEEREDFGEQASEANQARVFIDSVRKRKGLPIEEKIVVSAEKQRTLTKMK